HIYQKVAQFVNIRLDITAAVMYCSIRKKVVVSIFNHAGTRGGWGYNVMIFRKIVKKFKSHLLGLIPEPSIVCRLSTTRLLRIIDYFATRLLKQLQCTESRFWIHLIYKTGYK